jgi:hypothetical protein
LISIRKFHSRLFEGLLDHGERCPTRLALSGLKLADSDNTNPSGLRELLLAPINESASCSALRGCEHG